MLRIVRSNECGELGSEASKTTTRLQKGKFDADVNVDEEVLVGGASERRPTYKDEEVVGLVPEEQQMSYISF